MDGALGKSQAKRPRKWAPKVKSGCITCKLRRIKCDETKPSCLQCKHVRRICEGYGQVRSERQKKVAAVATQQALLPKITPSSGLPCHSPIKPLFENDQEKTCFLYFCSTTSMRLSRPFQSELWSRLVPQACEAHSSIRHAVIAIAGLDMISEKGSSSSNTPNRDRMTAQQTEIYHRFALKQYNKAVNQMLAATTGGSQDVRTVLLTCLIIVCFEAFYGNHESALAQLQVGIGIINKFSNKSGSKPDDPSGLSPYASDVEEELIRAYAHLDINAMMLLRSRRVLSYSPLASSCLRIEPGMPEEFISVQQSKIYLGSVNRRVMRLYEIYNDDDFPSRPSQSPYTLEDASAVLVAYSKEIDGILTSLVDWRIAFDPILQSVGLSPETTDFCAAMTLKIHYLITYYSVSTLPHYTSSSGQDWTPMFAEVISLARSILNHPENGDAKFTFDIQIIKPLYTVACRCSKIALRRQAIALLLAKPRREGLWDSMLSGKVAEWVTEIEGERENNGYVSKEYKISNLWVTADMLRRSASVEGWIQDSASFEPVMIVRKTVLSW